MKSQTVYRLLAIAPFLLVCMPVVSLSAEPLLTPAPRHLTWTDERLPLSAPCTVVAVTEEEQQVARVLRDEMLRLHGVRVSVHEQARGRGTVVLALTSTPAGKLWLAKADGLSLWQANHNEEAYLLEVSDSEAVLLAD
ncbi:MAG TPA: glycoside hydrolase family 20 zincin-like fold domain-containing protein, partial [Acidobacteriota bacterium]|nr:glycoside hydrolase family 20 zincin-like fold domain-containing protein [Acidobacteriota bacterium]